MAAAEQRQVEGRLWRELGSTMRRVRAEAGVSLRDLEDRGRWRRSTLSQVETARARPSRDLIDWFEDELGTDGLLRSIFAEAVSRRSLERRGSGGGEGTGVLRQLEDRFEVESIDPPAGLLVAPGARVELQVVLRNAGTVPWRGRRLRRMGAYAGTRLIGTRSETPVPDTRPGDSIAVTLELHAPVLVGSAVAYWSMVDVQGRERADRSDPVAMVLVVR